MQRTSVQSSSLHSVGYEEETKTLEIEFNNGSVYRYYGVPFSVYQGLMSAPSHGKYFHQHIRDVYPYTRVK